MAPDVQRDEIRTTPPMLSPEDEKRPVVGFLRLAGWSDEKIAGSSLAAAAESAFALLDNWLHTGNLPEREYAYAIRDGLGIALQKVQADDAD